MEIMFGFKKEEVEKALDMTLAGVPTNEVWDYYHKFVRSIRKAGYEIVTWRDEQNRIRHRIEKNWEP